ncbi:MAG: hypothetical protein C0605_08030 [Hyphomicrobiales bacterium]|nr:MAG: hypothetical protein C0605_08030 [Hyphomicrobiales bacterium]
MGIHFLGFDRSPAAAGELAALNQQSMQPRLTENGGSRGARALGIGHGEQARLFQLMGQAREGNRGSAGLRRGGGFGCGV